MLLDADLTVLLFGLVVVSLVLSHIHSRLFSRASLPDELPWVGAKGSALSRAKAVLLSVVKTRQYLEEGYYKYSKQNKPYVLPNILTGPEVIIPMSQLRWLLEQPDSILSQNEVNRQFLEADYTMLHPNIIRDTVHERVIRREMTNQLGPLTEDMVDEVEFALEQNWGVDTEEWREVPVYDTMADIIRRISNRVLVGVPLCRDKDYLKSSGSFSRNVVITAGMINLLPHFLRPYIIPMIQKRKEQIAKNEKFPVSSYKEQNDYIQWALRHAFKHWDPNERTSEMISKRLAVLSFAAIQSSVITMTNTLFDLVSSPFAAGFMSDLRNEVELELGQESGSWTKTCLARMTHIDSALRESMRLCGFVSRGVLKMVVAPEGVTLPDGTHLPPGTKVGVSAYSIHHDESAYSGAYIYDAFRFSRPSKDAAKVECVTANKAEKAARDALKGKTPALVTTSDTFMAFSHGRHACPGRFFAAHQLKLTLAHIMLNYDIEPLAERPENKWLVSSIGPPMKSTIRVKRRPGTVGAI
ncbi:hypothetical protein GP486_001771 [Trichoglossum hirsutum]|uniref:Cytochrome P450 n=1 Tax=Trichoglossum hirsutum TaxID=265104 RepID=A0A9P8LFI1_9PEZI|nr:hypothetical protein GP486_001771 [Trichoglossum hirsutum]